MSRLSPSLLLGVSLFLAASPQAGASGQAGDAAGDDPKAAAEAAVGAPQPPAEAAPSKSELKPLIEGAAKRHGVELALVKAVISAESAYNAHAVSSAGAVGLMQLMPATAADYGVGDTDRLFDPAVNVETGVRHLKRLLSKYNNDYGRVIMAYNAGEGVVDRTNSNVTYAETLAYTEGVINRYRRNGGTQPTEEALRKVKLLRSMKNTGKARQLMAQYLDLSIPELKVRHNRNIRFIEPGLDSTGPKSRPMIVLEAREKD
jgi:soluble lytic murein transglycosylase-like protein